MDKDSLLVYACIRLSPTGSSDPDITNRSSSEESDEETFRKEVYCTSDTTSNNTADEPCRLISNESLSGHGVTNTNNEAVRRTTSDSSCVRQCRRQQRPENDRGQNELNTTHRTCFYLDNERPHSWHGHSTAETTTHLKSYHTGVPLQRKPTLTNISQVFSNGKLAHLIKSYYDIQNCTVDDVGQTPTAISHDVIRSTSSPTATTHSDTSTTPPRSGTRVDIGTFDLPDRNSRINNNRCTPFGATPVPNEQPARQCLIRRSDVNRLRVYVTYISDEHINDVRTLVSVLCRTGVIVDFDKSPECFAVQRLNMQDWLDSCYRKV